MRYVGQTVHYVSYGTPGGEYRSECRAAIVTEVPDHRPIGEDQVVMTRKNSSHVSLCVLNPTGQFFNQLVPYDDSDQPAGGTWHENLTHEGKG